jgi:hypothetical protein
MSYQELSRKGNGRNSIPAASFGRRMDELALRMNDVEGSRYLGISVSTLRRDRAKAPNNAIPFLRIGGRVIYDRSDLDEFLRKRKTRRSAGGLR